MDNRLYNEYAIAYLDLAKSINKVDSFYDELVDVYENIHENTMFLKLLNATNISKEKRYQIIDRVFKNNSTYLTNYIKVILKNNRSYYLYKILKETIYRFDDYLNIETGTIYSTYKLDKESKKRIIQALENHLNKKIYLKEVIDTNLIGGFRIVLKNDVYDSSVLRFVHNLKKKLLS